MSTKITIENDESKAALLREKAKKFGFLPEQFVLATIEALIRQPKPDFKAAMERVLSKNRELYRRIA